MLSALLLLAYPLPEALHRFPDWSTCCTQIARCRDHLDDLERLRHLHGWQGGAWDRAREETERRLGYWRQLELCHSAATWEAEGDVRVRLEALRRLIGPERFLEGWRPDELPYVPTPGVVGSVHVNAAGR